MGLNIYDFQSDFADLFKFYVLKNRLAGVGYPGEIDSPGCDTLESNVLADFLLTLQVMILQGD